MDTQDPPKAMTDTRSPPACEGGARSRRREREAGRPLVLEGVQGSMRTHGRVHQARSALSLQLSPRAASVCVCVGGEVLDTQGDARGSNTTRKVGRGFLGCGSQSGQGPSGPLLTINEPATSTTPRSPSPGPHSSAAQPTHSHWDSELQTGGQSGSGLEWDTTDMLERRLYASCPTKPTQQPTSQRGQLRPGSGRARCGPCRLWVAQGSSCPILSQSVLSSKDLGPGRHSSPTLADPGLGACHFLSRLHSSPCARPAPWQSTSSSGRPPGPTFQGTRERL